MLGTAGIEKFEFGRTEDGQSVSIYRISNNQGAYIEVSDYGCTIMGMSVFQRDNQRRDVIRSYDKWEEYRYAQTQLGSVVISGDWNTPLHHRLWSAAEGEDNALIFSTEAEEGGCLLRAEIRFRMKDFNRLVIDYAAWASQDRLINLTHKVGFCMDDDETLATHKMRVFAKQELDNAGAAKPVDPDAVSGMVYGPVPDGKKTYLSPEKEIHPFIELASDATDLTLTAYSTMPAMTMERAQAPLPAAYFKANAMGVRQKDERWTERTVYGVDLLYHPNGGPTANPFAFFMG